MTIRIAAAALLALALSACSAVRREAALDATFRERAPRSIAVLPVLNRSGHEDAGPVVASAASIPLAERGYYVFPVYVTDRVLRENGLTDPETIHATPPSRFRDLLGADAVLLVRVDSWRKGWFVLFSTVAVTLDYTLKDTRTGETLWHREHTVGRDSQAWPTGGGPVGALGLAFTMADAVATAAIDRAQLARRACAEIVSEEGAGLPAGPYRPELGQEGARLP